MRSLDMFRRLGVGLIVIGDSRDTRVVLGARCTRPFSKALFFLALGRAYQRLSLDSGEGAEALEGLRPVA